MFGSQFRDISTYLLVCQLQSICFGGFPWSVRGTDSKYFAEADTFL